MNKLSYGCLAAALVSLAGVGGAVSAPLGGIKAAAGQESAVIKVHRRSYHHHHHRHYRRDRVVEAPFTYVETGRRVVVEAPFTTVYVGRRGRYVRAPFVNIWIPR